MSGYVRTVQKRIMKRKGFQRGYAIKDSKIVKLPYPQFMEKSDDV